MTLQEELATLVREVDRVAAIVPEARWYVFGSTIKEKECPSDIDVAVVCASASEVVLVRQELRSICSDLPVHLFLMTIEEERELQFVETQGCRLLNTAN